MVGASKSSLEVIPAFFLLHEAVDSTHAGHVANMLNRLGDSTILKPRYEILRKRYSLHHERNNRPLPVLLQNVFFDMSFRQVKVFVAILDIMIALQRKFEDLSQGSTFL